MCAMEITTLFGLPAHPLLVHLPVVMVPLAGVLAVILAFRPVWLDRFGWVLVGLAGLGAVGAVLAAGSGEALEESVERTAVLREHAEMGETAQVVTIAFFVAVVAVVLLRWFVRRRAEGSSLSTFVSSRAGSLVLAAVLVASAAGATATVVQAGHQGATATWGDVEITDDDDDDDDGDDDDGDDDDD